MEEEEQVVVDTEVKIDVEYSYSETITYVDHYDEYYTYVG